MRDAYEALTDHFRKIDDLRHVHAISSWDEAAMMPVGGGPSRAEALASLGVVIHEMLTSEEIAELLDACSNLDLDEWQSANLREIEREYLENTCLTPDFVRASSLAGSNAEQAWRIHRAKNDWEAMAPHLEKVISFAREEAAVRSEATGLGLYDAMLDTYEPGMRMETLDQLFGDLKSELPDMIEAAIELQSRDPLLSLGDTFPIECQRDLGLEIMAVIGFDFEHGRLDVSHHPFCGGVQDDVRITTRYTEKNFIESLMAVVHETGHAMYEQGRPRTMPGQPVTRARSAGVHESQSLMMEMQIGRSTTFLEFITPTVRQTFDARPDDPAWSSQNIRRLYTNVERSLIRVDADELTYPLHVILRYEIEKELIEGRVEVADIPAMWDEKMMADLNLDTRGNYKDGCLQDVHWSAQLFGYFPTYTLGAMMAAQFFQAMSNSLPDLTEEIRQGQLKNAVDWLRKNVHGKGSLLTTDELMESATGEVLNARYFLDHLKSRYIENGT